MRRLLAALLGAALLLGAPSPAAADAGDRDPTFGGGEGFVTVRGKPYVGGVDVLPDGRIVTAGWHQDDEGRKTYAVTWFTAAGRAERQVEHGPFADLVTDVAVDAAGRVLVTSEAAVLRLTPDGHRDAAFGVDGRVALGHLGPVRSALLPDGRVVAAGGATVITLDEAGRRARTFDPLPEGTHVESVVVDRQGRVVVGGTTYVDRGAVGPRGISSPDPDLLLARFSVTGGLELVVQERTYYGVTRLVEAPDGDLVLLAGGRLERRTPAGALDRSWGFGGYAAVPDMVAGSLVALEEEVLVALPDGSVVVAVNEIGTVSTARFSPEGRYDTGYGECGRSIVDPGFADEWVFDADLGPGGRVVVAGNSWLWLPGWTLPQSLVAVQGLDGGPRVRPQRDTGHWTVNARGEVGATGAACHHGDMAGRALNRPVVGMASTPSGDGYWLVADDGGIFSFGDAVFRGSTGAMRLNQPIVGMAPTPTGRGYWLVASDGGIFSFGDARFFGSTGAIRLNRPIVGMAATASGRGYWLVADDGGVFTFGDAAFLGSAAGLGTAPVAGMAVNPSGRGYWIARRDRTVHGFGDATLRTQPRTNGYATEVAAVLPARNGRGYRLLGRIGEQMAVGDSEIRYARDNPVFGVVGASQR